MNKLESISCSELHILATVFESSTDELDFSEEKMTWVLGLTIAQAGI